MIWTPGVSIFLGVMGTIFAVIFFLTLYFKNQEKARPKDIADMLEKQIPRKDSGGYAKIRTLEEIEGKEGDPKSGFHLGQFTERSLICDPKSSWKMPYTLNGREGSYLYGDKESNTIIFSMTRSGKTSGFVIPTLLQLAQSVFCIDPDAEVTPVTLPFRHYDLRQPCYVIDPWQKYCKNEYPSFRLNPLDILDPDDPFIVDKAKFLAELMASKFAGERDTDFWDKGGTKALASFLLLVALEEQKKTGQRTLKTVRDLLYRPPEDTKKLLEQMADMKDFDGAIARGAVTLEVLGKNASGDIMGTLQTAVDFLESPAINEVLSTTDFQPETLKHIASSIYLIVPDDQLKIASGFMRLMMGMVLHHLKKETSFRYRTHLVIDEAASLGKMEAFYEMARTLKRGINFNVIYQDMHQLRKVFGEDGAKIIMDQCANQIFLRPNCLETLKYISESIGNETVWTESFSTQTGYQQTSTSTSKSPQSRAILNPDEVKTGPPDRAYLFQPSENPAFTKAVPYFADAVLKKLAAPNPHHIQIWDEEMACARPLDHEFK